MRVLHERDLLPSEMVAIKRIIEPVEHALARKHQGSRTDLLTAKLAGGPGESRDRIASYMGIGRTTLEKANEVVEAAEENPEEFGHLVDQMDRSGKISGAYKKLIVQRQAKKLEKEAAIFPSGPFRVIVADPPWRYDSGNSLPYPTMAIEEIKALAVQSISADDSVLWLWTTNAHLRVAFDVVDAWGFEYRTMLTWVKDRMGTGEWLRGQTEHCLLAVRGKPTFIHGNHATVLEAVRREHSRKPEEFFELVEATCPGNKVELFSRRQRTGWEAFGNDTNRFDGR